MQIKQTIFALVFGMLPFGLTACNQPMAQMMDHGTSETGSQTETTETTDAAPMQHNMADMDLGPKDENFDLRFIDGMVLHHQGAIVMAESALQNSQRPEMKQLAQNIIAAQNQEISQMQQWRQTWYPTADATPMMYHAQMGHMMPMSDEMRSAMMMNVDLGAADDRFDLRFLNAMIPHHEGALVMAKQALEGSDRPEMLKLAQDILTTQQQEIDQMQQWRQEWYGQ